MNDLGTAPEPHGPMQCRVESNTMTNHVCVCVGRRGHASSGDTQDAWHVCGECGTVWTDEREATLDGDAKVLQLRRIPTDQVYAPGAVQVGPTALTGEADACVVCSQPGGLRVSVELGEYVHAGCKPGWMFAAEAARQMVNQVLQLAGAGEIAGISNLHEVRPAPYRFMARVLCQIGRNNSG